MAERAKEGGRPRQEGVPADLDLPEGGSDPSREGGGGLLPLNRYQEVPPPNAYVF